MKTFHSKLPIGLSIGIALLSFSLPSPLLATSHPTGLVPCENAYTKNPDGSSSVTNPCDACQVFKLSENILNFVYIDITIPLAALMLLWGGFLMISSAFSGNPGAAERGKKILRNTILGICIIFFAWIGIDAIIKLLMNKDITESTPAELFRTGFGPWNKIECVSSTVFFPAPAPPSAPGPSPLAEECKKDDSLRDGDDICNNVNTRPFVEDSIRNPEGQGIRGERVGKCAPGTLASLPGAYDTFFTSASSDFGVGKSLLQAVMLVESSGDAWATSEIDNDGRHSYGLMQVRPETACEIDSSIGGCGKDSKGRGVVNDFTKVIWSLQNPRTNIRVGAVKLKALRTKYGSDELALASYNGGYRANENSAFCGGQRKWQCLWDNAEHTKPNKRPGHPGYGYTRDYVPKVKATEQQINNNQC